MASPVVVTGIHMSQPYASANLENIMPAGQGLPSAFISTTVSTAAADAILTDCCHRKSQVRCQEARPGMEDQAVHRLPGAGAGCQCRADCHHQGEEAMEPAAHLPHLSGALHLHCCMLHLTAALATSCSWTGAAICHAHSQLVCHTHQPETCSRNHSANMLSGSS